MTITMRTVLRFVGGPRDGRVEAKRTPGRHPRYYDQDAHSISPKLTKAEGGDLTLAYRLTGSAAVLVDQVYVITMTYTWTEWCDQCCHKEEPHDDGFCSGGFAHGYTCGCPQFVRPYIECGVPPDIQAGLEGCATRRELTDLYRELRRQERITPASHQLMSDLVQSFIRASTKG